MPQEYNQADNAAPADETANLNQAADAGLDNIADIPAEADLTPEAREEKAQAEQAANEKSQKEASERTRKRREQRRNARAKRDAEARAKAEQEAAYYKGLAEGRSTAGVKDQADQDPRPMRADFIDEDEYFDARYDWKERQKERAQPTKTQRQEPEQSRQQPQDAQAPSDTKTTYDDFKGQGQEQYGDDFDDMLRAADDGEFALTRDMYEAMMDTDVSVDISMYLYDNPDESRKIAKLSPYRQTKEIEKIKQTIAGQKGSSEPPNTDKPADTGRASTTLPAPTPRVSKKVSNAPPPVRPEKKDGTVSPTDLSKLSTEAFIRKRNKQLHG